MLHNASTVILIRDGTDGLQVLMMKRPSDAPFAGGAYVFPGGVLQTGDCLDEELCNGLTDARASEILGLESGGLAYWVSAIRECFEETGILLAYDSNLKILDMAELPVRQRFHDLRKALVRREVSLEGICRRESLTLAADRIHYWAHWITPQGKPLRFDTRFFLTAAPASQHAAHDGKELTDSTWIRPREALSRAASRKWLIILPTVHNLLDLNESNSTRAAVRKARSRDSISAIQPEIVGDDAGLYFETPGHPECSEALRIAPNPTREEGSQLR